MQFFLSGSGEVWFCYFGFCSVGLVVVVSGLGFSTACFSGGMVGLIRCRQWRHTCFQSSPTQAHLKRLGQTSLRHQIILSLYGRLLCFLMYLLSWLFELCQWFFLICAFLCFVFFFRTAHVSAMFLPASFFLVPRVIFFILLFPTRVLSWLLLLCAGFFPLECCFCVVTF